MVHLDPALCRLPDGRWSCTRDHRTEPCGDCDGCRSVFAERRALVAAAHAQIEAEEGRCVHFNEPFPYRECEAEILNRNHIGEKGAEAE